MFVIFYIECFIKIYTDMTLKQFVDKYKDYLNHDITELVMGEVVNGSIPFLKLQEAYVKYLEKLKEWNKCELIESAFLLHLRMSGLSHNIPDVHERELHVINKHSNLCCDKENEGSNYDPEKMDKVFRKNYNIL